MSADNCLICDSALCVPATSKYTEPDKYEVAAGVSGGRRWFRCNTCGFYQCIHDYHPVMLNTVYEDHYRSVEFRNEKLRDVFTRIIDLPEKESENLQRVNYISCQLKKPLPQRWVDIGSGLGVFPYELNQAFDGDMVVECIEPNQESVNFITDHLELTCDAVPVEVVHLKRRHYDVVSLIHVLEHLGNPDLVLGRIKDWLVSGGTLFIEVPSASEFQTLDHDHDEFNSCHLYFFDEDTLACLLYRNGFGIKDIRTIEYKHRGMTRVYALAYAKDI